MNQNIMHIDKDIFILIKVCFNNASNKELNQFATILKDNPDVSEIVELIRHLKNTTYTTEEQLVNFLVGSLEYISSSFFID